MPSELQRRVAEELAPIRAEKVAQQLAEQQAAEQRRADERSADERRIYAEGIAARFTYDHFQQKQDGFPELVQVLIQEVKGGIVDYRTPGDMPVSTSRVYGVAYRLGDEFIRMLIIPSADQITLRAEAKCNDRVHAEPMKRFPTDSFNEQEAVEWFESSLVPLLKKVLAESNWCNRR